MRKDILLRKQEILKWIEETKPKAFICRQLKCKQETLDFWLNKMDIQYKGNQGLKNLKSNSKRISAIEYAKGDCVKSHRLRLKLIQDDIKDELCENCKLVDWCDTKIPLELHHIDNNHFNNQISNLMIVCPNCHHLLHHKSKYIKD